MEHNVDISWLGKMAFETEINGHKIVVDADESIGGENKGPRPKPFMLLALAGCTAIDVVSILTKMKIKLDAFNVIVSAPLSENHPVHYTSMHVTYKIKGKDIPVEKVRKAVELSEEKYCGVSALLKKTLQITSEIIIE